MSWLLPSALIIAGIGMLGAVATHLIARRRPLAEPFPTARFIPERAIRARTRSMALSDPPLLLLRVAAIAAVGIAAAGPVVATSRGGIRRVVLVDRSRVVASGAELRDSVRAYARAGDVLIAVDSVASPFTLSAVTDVQATQARGSLSAGLAAAVRSGAELAARSDSLELVIVSPFAREEVDDATLRLRAVWPGRVRLVPISAIAGDTTAPAVEVSSATNDAVASGLALAHLVRSTDVAPAVRVVRGRMTSADTAWAGAGHVVVHWPATETETAWPPRATIDAIGGVMSASGTLIGRFPRLWLLTGRPVARWADGEPAAVETLIGAGCIRDVALLINEQSDLTLRPAFREFARALLSRCGGAVDAARSDSTTLALLAGSGPLAPAARLRAAPGGVSRATPWLLALGALLLLLELVMRRRSIGVSTSAGEMRTT